MLMKRNIITYISVITKKLITTNVVNNHGLKILRDNSNIISFRNPPNYINISNKKITYETVSEKNIANSINNIMNKKGSYIFILDDPMIEQLSKSVLFGIYKSNFSNIEIFINENGEILYYSDGILHVKSLALNVKYFRSI